MSAQKAQDDAPEGIPERLEMVFGKETSTAVAERLQAAGWDISHDTVARYRRGDVSRIMADFVAAVASAYRVSGHWLLTGYGTRRVVEDEKGGLRPLGDSDVEKIRGLVLDVLGIIDPDSLAEPEKREDQTPEADEKDRLAREVHPQEPTASNADAAELVRARERMTAGVDREKQRRAAGQSRRQAGA